jgi:type I site-specific restriction-modification system R (restriction) subunit
LPEVRSHSILTNGNRRHCATSPKGIPPHRLPVTAKNETDERQQRTVSCAKERDPEAHKQKFLSAVSELSKSFALAVPHDKAIAIRDEVGFFQTVRVALVKPLLTQKKQTTEKLDQAIRQIISRAVASDEVIDVFAAAGLKKPDISILSDEFLGQVKGMQQRNLAVELLRNY